jgi:hypothetical protein
VPRGGPALGPVAEPLRALAALGGAVVLAGVAASVVVTVLTPRVRSSRLSTLVARAVRAGVVRASTMLARTWPQQDAHLALMAPAVLLAQLGSWLALSLVGWTLVAWPLDHAALAATARSVVAAGLTLDLAPPARGAGVVAGFGAAATGPLVVAMQIAYFPTLYQAVNRREALVTLLEARAGSPPWGPEVLRRHWFFDLVDRLPTFYDAWERWAAEVLESHGSYRTLMFFRSPAPWRAWPVSLLAVLDSAALLHAVAPGSAPREARLCLQMGAQCFRQLAGAFGLAYEADPDPDRTPLALGREQFEVAYEYLRAGGVPLERDLEDAFTHFRGWRVNYETAAYAIAQWTVAPPAPWSGPRRHVVARVELPAPAVHRSPGGGRYVEPRLAEARGPEAVLTVDPCAHPEPSAEGD